MGEPSQPPPGSLSSSPPAQDQAPSTRARPPRARGSQTTGSPRFWGWHGWSLVEPPPPPPRRLQRVAGGPSRFLLAGFTLERRRQGGTAGVPVCSGVEVSAVRNSAERDLAPPALLAAFKAAFWGRTKARSLSAAAPRERPCPGPGQCAADRLGAYKTYILQHFWLSNSIFFPAPP